MNKIELKRLIERNLRRQGFHLSPTRVTPPTCMDKNRIRDLHHPAVLHRREVAKKGLLAHETTLLARLATGSEIDPLRIKPELIEVQRGSEDERLFRYAALHWSIPVSSGYGRRLRFLLIDQSNGKLIGLFGLADPVYNLGPRDAWVGWEADTRRRHLRYVMDAFALGAVPPYSFLLCGKLVAMLVASSEVRRVFRRKYSGKQSLIGGQRLDGKLAMISTTSALGRSSIYNRLRFDGRLLYESVGFTRGAGEFHFSNGLYRPISDYAERYCEPTAKAKQWGTGFRNRREVIKKVLTKVGISTEWLYHGVQREVFLVSLARNSRDFLAGKHSRLFGLHLPANLLAEYFRQRWLLPRAQTDERYKLWHPDAWRLWPACDEPLVGVGGRTGEAPNR